MEIANQQKQSLPHAQLNMSGGREQDVLLKALLALVFGPIGLLFGSLSGGFIMIILEIIIAILTFTFGTLTTTFYGLALVQLVCTIWAVYATLNKYKTVEQRIKYRNTESILYKTSIVFLSFIVAVPLIIILLYIIRQGVTQVNWHFLTNVPKPVGETGGGILNALVGTLIIVAISAIIAIPVGMMAGIYLSENPKTRLAYWAGLCVDILQGVPSIVVGIVVYFWVVKPLGTFSAVSGSIALAIMMLPIVIRSTEETLKLLPPSLKEAALSLGVPYHRVIIKIIVPCGFSGILSGIVLSIARVIGETAPLLFTAFGNPYLSASIVKPMESLPHLIYTYATSPYDDWHDLAWGASFLLLVFVLVLNISTKLITKRWKVQL
ncbi:MAG TPA: phosphate ABC transporter permease PstA [Mucilaginibacter sp.]|nr:phosphate ABC transporter permease PstA [Mucilaginibacter sp.]